MGIHFGKVVMHDEKVFGDTVNIASRIESLGQPGAVLFSKEVLQEIKSMPETETALEAEGLYVGFAQGNLVCF